MITSSVEKCSIWFVFWITDSGDVVVSLKKTLKANMTGINIAKLEKIVFSKILDCGEK